jgi:hypothetical protein
VHKLPHPSHKKADCLIGLDEKVDQEIKIKILRQ